MGRAYDLLAEDYPEVLRKLPEEGVAAKWSDAIDLGRWDDALAILEQGLIDTLSYPDDVQRPGAQVYLYVLMGSTYLSLRQYRLAVRSCVHALRIRPQDISSWNQLGKVLLHIRKTGWAINCFQRKLQIAKATELAPNYKAYPSVTMISYVSLALAQDAAGNRKEAIALLHEALKIRPSNPTVGEALRKLEASEIS